jgi:periplasmic protein TonB
MTLAPTSQKPISGMTLSQSRLPQSGLSQSRLPLRQAIGVAAVVLLHVALIYALATGLGQQAIEILQAPLQTKIIEEIKPPPPDTPPPPPKLADLPPPYIPPPEVRIQQPTTTTNAITAIVHQLPPAPVAAAAPRPQPVHVPAVLGAASRCEKPDYPPMSERLGEEGTVVLRFLVDVDGTAVQSEVASSSGHERLDEAARSALGRCKFRPGTVDGRPEKSWAVIKYNWRIQ